MVLYHCNTVASRFNALASWWKGEPEKYWYTKAQLAKIIGCAYGSVSPAFSWLRRNGFTVTARWIHTRKKYVYNLRKVKLKRHLKDTDRSAEECDREGKKLRKVFATKANMKRVNATRAKKSKKLSTTQVRKCVTRIVKQFKTPALQRKKR